MNGTRLTGGLWGHAFRLLLIAGMILSQSAVSIPAQAATSWQKLPAAGIAADQILVNPNDGTVYLKHNDHVEMSTDHGLTWLRLSSVGLPSAASFAAIGLNALGEVLA
jgi:hypothetical protein